MQTLVLEGVAKTYGDATAVAGVDLDVRAGEFLTLLGPSGCGKTTTLRMIAGFVTPTRGRILMDGADISRLPPNRREVGMVFQNYALFPHLNVYENISFGMKQRGATESVRRTRVAELLELVQLQGYEKRLPAELSGGQRQRVAIARAVAHPPRVLLMDEPLGALDLKMREAMQRELRAIQRRLGITTIYVTHDQTEAMVMSDRIVVMNQGNIEQIGSPEEIYLRPTTKFVAQFVGRINLLPAARVDAATGLTVSGRDVMPPPAAATRLNGHDVLLAVRPEHMRVLGDEGQPGWNVLDGCVAERIFVGNAIQFVITLGNGQAVSVEARPGDTLPAPGEQVRVGWKPEDAIIVEH